MENCLRPKKELNNASASEAVRKGLNSIEVSKDDATKLELGLKGELFDKWSESFEVMQSTKIPHEKLDGFLDHLQNSYEGIDDEKRAEMGIIVSDKSWKQHIVEWNFNKPDRSGVRYGIVAFGRSSDGKYIDCIAVLLKVNFELASTKNITRKRRAGEIAPLSLTKTKATQTAEDIFGSINKKSLQNFFRLKALEECYKEGIIEKINYINLTDDLPRSSKVAPKQAAEKNSNLNNDSPKKKKKVSKK